VEVAADVRRGESGFELGFSAIEPADHVGADRPRGYLGRRGLLALAVGALIDRADETALDEHVRAFLDRGCNMLGQPGAKDVCYVESDCAGSNGQPGIFNDPLVSFQLGSPQHSWLLHMNVLV
jgi:hypothetical protein